MQALVFVLLFGQLMKRLFFGQLRAAESEVIVDSMQKKLVVGTFGADLKQLGVIKIFVQHIFFCYVGYLFYVFLMVQVSSGGCK